MSGAPLATDARLAHRLARALGWEVGTARRVVAAVPRDVRRVMRAAHADLCACIASDYLPRELMHLAPEELGTFASALDALAFHADELNITPGAYLAHVGSDVDGEPTERDAARWLDDLLHGGCVERMSIPGGQFRLFRIGE